MNIKIKQFVLMQAVDIQDLHYENRIKFLNDGIHFRAIDPVHAELLHARIPRGACDEYDLRKTGELEIGIDIDKLKKFVRIFKKNDEFELSYDPEIHRLIIKVSHLIRTMGLIDTDLIMIPREPLLRLRNNVVIDSKLFHDNLKRVLFDNVEKTGIEQVIISDEKGDTMEEWIDVVETKYKMVYDKVYLKVLPDRILFENQSDDEDKDKTKESIIQANNKYLEVVSFVEQDNITGLNGEILLKRVTAPRHK